MKPYYLVQTNVNMLMKHQETLAFLIALSWCC